MKDKTYQTPEVKILEAVSKSIDPPERLPVSLVFWCVVCTMKHEIFKKKKGNLVEQSICQHMVFKEMKY